MQCEFVYARERERVRTQWANILLYMAVHRCALLLLTTGIRLSVVVQKNMLHPYSRAHSHIQHISISSRKSFQWKLSNLLLDTQHCEWIGIQKIVFALPYSPIYDSVFCLPLLPSLAGSVHQIFPFLMQQNDVKICLLHKDALLLTQCT